MFSGESVGDERKVENVSRAPAAKMSTIPSSAPVLKVCLLRYGAALPMKAYPGDAAFDVYLVESLRIPGNSVRTVGLGIAVEMPAGMYGMILERSSCGKEGVVSIGRLIDNGYRGELHATLANLTEWEIEYAPGERVVQLLLANNNPGLSVEQVDQLADSPRGEKRHGSSGR